ncbi:hypothetical protein JOB18_032204 [Solea senegalensis]|uniref:Uncharacterized protein n=1 Tax=Solea senegalensis TaxID=28829 RepID=A0AAV6QNE1_SOLSE|nr:hypothetical protein JOB18_032204 [Solea senegalensis]
MAELDSRVLSPRLTAPVHSHSDGGQNGRERKGRVTGNMAANCLSVFERQPNETDPPRSAKTELAEWCARVSGAAGTRDVDIFSFSAPVAICIISIPHKQQRKKKKTQIDEVTMAA